MENNYTLLYGGAEIDELLAKQAAESDHVVEQAINMTDNAWSVRKWASGVAECWGYFTWTDVAITKAWGSLYESTNPYYVTFPADLFVGEAPRCLMTNGGGGAAMLEVGGGLSLTKSANAWFVRPNTTTGTCAMNVHAIGRWK